MLQHPQDELQLFIYSRIVSNKRGVITCSILFSIIFLIDFYVLYHASYHNISIPLVSSSIFWITQYFHHIVALLYSISFVVLLRSLYQCIRSSMIPRYLMKGFYLTSCLRLLMYYLFGFKGTVAGNLDWLSSSFFLFTMYTIIFAGCNSLLIFSYPETSLEVTGSGLAMHCILHIGLSLSAHTVDYNTYINTGVSFGIYGLTFLLVRSKYYHHLQLFEQSYYYKNYKELVQKQEKAWKHVTIKKLEEVEWCELLEKVIQCFQLVTNRNLNVKLVVDQPLSTVILSNETLIEEITTFLLKCIVEDGSFHENVDNHIVVSVVDRHDQINENASVSYLKIDFKYHIQELPPTAQSTWLFHWTRGCTRSGSHFLDPNLPINQQHSDIRIEKYQEWIDLHGGYTFSDVFISQSSPGRESVGTSENVEDEQTTPSANVGTVVCSVGFALPYILPSQQSVSAEDTKDFSFERSTSNPLKEQLYNSLQQISIMTKSQNVITSSKYNSKAWEFVIISGNSGLTKILKMSISRCVNNYENDPEVNFYMFRSLLEASHFFQEQKNNKEHGEKSFVFITKDIDYSDVAIQDIRSKHSSLRLIRVESKSSQENTASFDGFLSLPFRQEDIMLILQGNNSKH